MTKFTAELRQHGRTATGISVPREVVEGLGAGKKPPVTVTLRAPEVDHSYRTTVAPRGEEFLVPVSAEVRAAAGVAAGDVLEVEVVLDTAPRTVTVPDDLVAALGDQPAARTFFDGLSYSHQRAYTLWIEDAKRPETRAARVSRAVEMLREGKRRS